MLQIKKKLLLPICGENSGWNDRHSSTWCVAPQPSLSGRANGNRTGMWNLAWTKMRSVNLCRIRTFLLPRICDNGRYSWMAAYKYLNGDIRCRMSRYISSSVYSNTPAPAQWRVKDTVSDVKIWQFFSSYHLGGRHGLYNLGVPLLQGGFMLLTLVQRPSAGSTWGKLLIGRGVV